MPSDAEQLARLNLMAVPAYRDHPSEDLAAVRWAMARIAELEMALKRIRDLPQQTAIRDATDCANWAVEIAANALSQAPAKEGAKT